MYDLNINKKYLIIGGAIVLFFIAVVANSCSGDKTNEAAEEVPVITAPGDSGAEQSSVNN